MIQAHHRLPDACAGYSLYPGAGAPILPPYRAFSRMGAGVPWVRLDQDFPDHPKIVAAGPVGMVIYIRALCYASRYLTDGFIPDQIADKIVSDLNPGKNWISILIREKLWRKVKGGFKIHDYLEHNRSAAEVRKLQKERALAGKKGGIAKAQQVASQLSEHISSKALPDTDTDTDLKKDPPIVPQGDDQPTLTGLEKPTRRRTKEVFPEGFDAFWSAYPNKSGPKAAIKAWVKLRPSSALSERIVKAVENQKGWTKWQQGYITNPATWLNGGHWDDEPPEMGPTGSGPEIEPV